jgi:hypothetical protein
MCYLVTVKCYRGNVISVTGNSVRMVCIGMLCLAYQSLGIGLLIGYLLNPYLLNQSLY